MRKSTLPRKVLKAFLCFSATFLFLDKSMAKETGEKILEMTYTFDSHSVYWPTGNAFKSTKVFGGINPGGWWYASNDYSANEHGGTHIDAPIHFHEKGKSIEQIPLSQLIGPAVKIDVTLKCKNNRNYLLTVDDIKAFEKEYGPIPAHAWVIMYSGIDTQYYPDRKKVLGTDMLGENAVEFLEFPGFSPEAAQYLVAERSILGVAIDTPSTDYGKSKDFKTHRILAKANKLGIENIAGLDKLPPVGATLFAIPMLIKGGTGAPTRVFAELP